jgi:hypothetical protein
LVNCTVGAGVTWVNDTMLGDVVSLVQDTAASPASATFELSSIPDAAAASVSLYVPLAAAAAPRLME